MVLSGVSVKRKIRYRVISSGCRLLPDAEPEAVDKLMLHRARTGLSDCIGCALIATATTLVSCGTPAVQQRTEDSATPIDDTRSLRQVVMDRAARTNSHDPGALAVLCTLAMDQGERVHE